MDVCLRALATYPSKKSVKHAVVYREKAIQSPQNEWVYRLQTMPGIIKMRKNVKMFGSV
jgi:hypothetical protein